jgi:hypothetical protein
VTDVELVVQLKPVTDEQVFYDKFLCDNFYLPSACVCICNKFYMSSFHMTSFIYWCERVTKFTLTIY